MSGVVNERLRYDLRHTGAHHSDPPHTSVMDGVKEGEAQAR